MKRDNTPCANGWDQSSASVKTKTKNDNPYI